MAEKLPPEVQAVLERSRLELKRLRLEVERLETRAHAPIAVVVMACRSPGGIDGPEAFWQLIEAGKDAITELAPRGEALGLPAPPDPSPSVRYAGQGRALDVFDAEFFATSPREATYLDPQHRLLMEVAWEALEEAGIAADKLVGS